MNKYKVGDKVRTIKLRDCGGTKLFPIGTIAVIEDIKNKTKGGFDYVLSVKNKFYYYSEDMIEPYIEKTYEDGLNDAWKVLKHIQSGELSSKEIMDIWGMTDLTFVNCFAQKYKPQEALEILEAYEESKVFKVGDVVECFSDYKAVVLDCDVEQELLDVFNENGCVDGLDFSDVKKIGRHIDISSLLEQIRGDQ